MKAALASSRTIAKTPARSATSGGDGVTPSPVYSWTHMDATRGGIRAESIVHIIRVR